MGEPTVRARFRAGTPCRWARAACLAWLVVAATGCADVEEDADAQDADAQGVEVVAAESDGAAAEDRVLELWYMPNGSDPQAMIDAEVEHFERLHPGVRVNATMIGWEEALTKLATATVSGDGPDVTQVGSTWVSGLAETGAFRAFSEAEIDRFGGRDGFVAESWTSTRDADERTVAIPWMLDTRVLYYRADVFEDLGIDPVEAFADWASFEAALQVIEDGSEIHPLGIPGRNDWNVVHNATPWIWAAGGTLLNDDGTASMLAEPEAVHGLYEFQRLVARYGHPESLTSTDAASQELFAAGEFAVTLSGPWFERIMIEDHADTMPAELWSASAVPAGPAGRVSFLGGSHLAVFDDSEHPDDAMTLVSFLTATEHQERASALTGLLPANVEATTTTTGAVAEAFGQALASGRQYPAVPVWLDVEATLQRSFSHMWEGVESTTTPMTPLTPVALERILRDAGDQIDAALQSRD